MLYLGFPILIEEALRILHLDNSFVKSYYHTDPIENYLRSKGSQLLFQYIDKGSCLFGLAFSDSKLPFYDALEEMIEKKKLFWEEVHKLDLDLTYLQITDVECEGVCLPNPQPYLMSL